MEPILTKFVREPNSFTLDFYLDKGGYSALKKALTLTPDQIIDMVKASGLRGRGGAGFPTGMKWQFVDKKIEPRYIACNADESEPGTFKDHLLMERNPHLLIEGCAMFPDSEKTAVPGADGTPIFENASAPSSNTFGTSAIVLTLLICVGAS